MKGIENGIVAYLMFAACAALAMACGSLVMMDLGISAQRIMLNWTSLVAGVGAGFVLVRSPISSKLLHFLLIAGLVILALSLLGSPQSGVRRWINLGPFTLNSAAISLPMITALLARHVKSSAQKMAIIAAIMTILVLQPDSSQAVAFALAAGVIITTENVSKTWWKFGLLAISIGLAVARDDRLGPVPEVELIMGLSWQQSPLIAVVAAIALCAITVIPAYAASWRNAGLALSTYFAATIMAPAFGYFPVPIVGYGMAFPIGFMLGFAVLLGVKEPQIDVKPLREQE
jgi:hypothetical protein